jgi:hypothetical protein
LEKRHARWGNLAIFYKDFGYATRLVRLGSVESGLKELATLSKGATVVLERVEKKRRSLGLQGQ